MQGPLVESNGLSNIDCTLPHRGDLISRLLVIKLSPRFLGFYLDRNLLSSPDFQSPTQASKNPDFFSEHASSVWISRKK